MAADLTKHLFVIFAIGPTGIIIFENKILECKEDS